MAVGLAREDFDLQLTRYDEKGWDATFYTTGMEHSPTSATGTRMGTHAVARDAAGGMGGARARERLTTLRNLLARLTRGTRFWRRTELGTLPDREGRLARMNVTPRRPW